MFRSRKKQYLAEKSHNFLQNGSEIVINNKRNESYPFRLTMYHAPPQGDVGVEEFGLWATDRLHVFAEIESKSLTTSNLKELEQAIRPILDQKLPMSSNASRSIKSKEIDFQRRKDYYSHYILRLAFCRSDELLKKFLKLETTLFKLRYITDNIDERQEFIKTLDLAWETINSNEKAFLEQNSIILDRKRDQEYIKVNFEQVPELLSTRKVILAEGKAFVPSSEQISLVASEFSDRLQRALQATSRILPSIESDDRLVPILNSLSQGFITLSHDMRSIDVKGGSLNANQVDSASKHFPLCMRSMHSHLRRNHHLKYFGRYQYGLFLKGIGLSVEEALRFWKLAFSKMTEDEFKEHQYNIRHSYGLEGSRKNYRPMSCSQMIMGPISASNECFGCPFRQQTDRLTEELKVMKIDKSNGLDEILKLSQMKQYHNACSRVFEITHSSGSVPLITHPIQYYSMSRDLTTTDSSNQR